MPNVTDYLMQGKLEASRRIAGLAFFYPCEAIKKADGLDAKLFTDPTAQAFWMMLISRKDEITDNVFGHGVAESIAQEMGWFADLSKWYAGVTYDVLWFETFNKDIETLRNTDWAVNQVESIIGKMDSDETEAEPEPPTNFVELPESESPVAKTRWTVAELLDTTFPEPRWAIPGLIPEGLSIVGGRPKLGKSIFMLQVAHSIGTGGMFFGRKVEKGNVLYIDLENGPRRMQERIRKQGIPKDALIAFERKWRPFHKGGIDDLLIEIERVEYRLIIVDTFTRAFAGMDQNDQPIIGKIMDDLQRMATNKRLTLAFIDHINKLKWGETDPVEDIMNSTVKTATVDAVFALYREQGKKGAVLKGRGRDFEDIDLTIEWHVPTLCWQLVGETGDLRITQERNEILSAIETLGKCQCTDIARAIGKDRSNVFHNLQNLIAAGLVMKEDINGKVYFSLI